jgi:beta-barrel assembly-enhancing protease
MKSLFYGLGRKVGRGVIPAIRKSRWVWQSLTGNEADAVHAEAGFGRALAAELRLKVGTSQDPEDNALIQGIASRLCACLRNKERAFRVDIARVKEYSAIALPGGFIFVNAGLLDFCQRDPDELAFVIGHEMGHIVRGHALERMLSRIGAEGLSAILSRGLLNPILRQTGIKWLESAHSRQAELDADEFGVRAALAAGYEPKAALRLFQRLQRLRNEREAIGDYFASHPPEAERMANIQAVLKQAQAEAAARLAGKVRQPGDSKPAA